MAPTGDLRDELFDHLRALAREGGDHNRVVVGDGDRYLLVVGARGSDDLEVEVAAPLASLTSRGFVSQRGRRNPTRRHPGIVADAPGLRALVDEALEIVGGSLGVDADALRVARQSGDRPASRSPELVRAMKVLAATREMSARQRVYHEIMRSTLLLAVTEDDPDEPHVFEHLQGYPVIGVFTDWDALRLWEPRGWPVQALPGHQILPMARERRVGSLLINRRGDVGGELLMNEIAALAEASPRYASR